MNVLEIVIDILCIFGPPRPDNDRSIVGESPIEQSISRFWRRLTAIVLLAAVTAAGYVWVR